jgi:hypothetical protein
MSSLVNSLGGVDMAGKAGKLYQSGGFLIKQKDPVIRRMKTPQGI